MRIGMVAPLEMRVPPSGYGGTELIVSLLTEGLVRRGHSVTLFASGDSVTSARLVPGSERFLRGTDRDRGVLNMLNEVACLERAHEFDIIHNHSPLEGMSTAGLVDVPMLTTLHGHLNGDWRLLFERYKGWYNTISRSAKAFLPAKDRFAGVIYNSIDCHSYQFNPGPREDFLLFLSRISVEKGAHLAIRVAKEAGRRLIIAGNVDHVDREYFETEVLPHVDGEQIQYVGEADQTMKRDLMSRAACLLASNTWHEPFGLFMIEAMACGTPVIGVNKGSIPEVVEHGVTGFVVNDVDEMVAVLDRLDEIDPRACRDRVELHFDAPGMVDAYVRAYEQIVAEHGRHLWRTANVPVDTAGREQLKLAEIS